MPATHPMPLMDQVSRLLAVLADARSADAALRQVDIARRAIAGDSIFSIQRNVTTAHHPAEELRLQRFYSSEATSFPVQGTKRKTLTPWVDCLFLRGQVFVGEGTDVLAQTFDDYAQMSVYGVRSVVNVPLLQGNLCYATFNVFGTRAQWQAQEVLGLQLLALAAARWVPRAPGLAYRFNGVPFNAPVEA